MKPTTLLSAALKHKTASESCAAAPANNSPKAVEAPKDPARFSAGEYKRDSKKAPKSVKRASAVLDFLAKTAALPKVAAKRPGRLDGDEALDKLAKLHSKRKK